MATMSFLRRFVRRAVVSVGAVGLTLSCFLVLPLTQAIGKPREGDTLVRAVDTAALPPPPPPVEEEPEKEEKPDETPPELAEEPQRLDLSQLEVAIDAAMGSGWMTGDFGVKLNAIKAAAGDVDALFSLADLDQQPRVIYQPGPVLEPSSRRRSPGSVAVLFIVDQNGRVENPIVQSPTDPALDKAAVSAVKQWKFEPGKRRGTPVRFRMRVSVTFPGTS